MPIESLLSFFGGLVNHPAPHLLAHDQAVVCENVVIESGRIAPLKAATLATTVGTGYQSIVKFNGSWKSSSLDRWYGQSDFEGALRLYWADGGTPQKMKTDGSQARLGIVPPASGSVVADWATSVLNTEHFSLTEWEYFVTFYSDPLLAGGWGGESAPLSMGTIRTAIGTVSPAAASFTGVVAVKAGTYNYPPGGAAGYLASHLAGGFVKIGNTLVRFKTCTFSGPIGSATAYWQASTNYTGTGVGWGAVPRTTYTPASSRGYWYELTTINGAGVSGATEPTWPTTIGATVVDNDLVWTCRGEASYAWDLSGCKDIKGTDIPAYGASGAPAEGMAVVALVKEVDLTIPTSSDPQVNARRIYRSSGGEIKLVKQVNDNTTTTPPSDTTNETDLGAVLTTTGYEIPPDLEGICGPYNGMLIGWLGRILYGTQVGKPDAWQELFSFNYDIAAAIPFGGYVVVLCQDAPYTVSGSAPDAMSRHKSQSSQGCLYGRTVVDAGRGIIYLSPDGVVLFDGVSAQVASDKRVTRSSFTSMTNPRSAWHDGHYYLFFDTNEEYAAGGCMIADLRGAEPVWRTSTETAISLYRSDADDRLYLGRSDGIYEWGAGASLSWRYWTGELAFGSLMAEKILYDATMDCSGNVQVEVWIDGSRRHLKLVESPPKPYRMRMAGACRGRRIQIRMSGPAGTPGTVSSLEFNHSGPGRAR